MDGAYVVTWVHVQVCVHVPLVRAVYCPCHTWPCLLESQDTLNIVSVNLLTRNGVDDCRLDSKEWEGCGARLRGRDACKRRDDIGTSLGLPVCLIS